MDLRIERARISASTTMRDFPLKSSQPIGALRPLPATPLIAGRRAPTPKDINIKLCVTEANEWVVNRILSSPLWLQETVKLMVIGSLAQETGNFKSPGWRQQGYVGVDAPKSSVSRLPNGMFTNPQSTSIPADVFRRGGAMYIGSAQRGKSLAIGFPGSVREGSFWDVHAAMAYKLTAMSRLVAKDKDVKETDLMMLFLVATNVWYNINNTAWQHYKLIADYAGVDAVGLAEDWWSGVSEKTAENYFWYLKVSTSERFYNKKKGYGEQSARTIWEKAKKTFPVKHAETNNYIKRL